MKRLAVLLTSPPSPPVAAGTRAPEGQVAATVDGKEVTMSEVRAELGPLAGDPQAAARQPDALRTVVNRKLLADAAVARGLDKTPEGAMLLQKAHELALIQLLQDAVVRGVPKVGASRRRITSATVPNCWRSTASSSSTSSRCPTQLLGLVGGGCARSSRSTRSRRCSRARRSPSARGNDGLDPLTLQPEMLRDILANGQNGVFITPRRARRRAGAAHRRFRDAPLTGEERNAPRSRCCQRSAKTGDQLRRQFEGIIADGQKDVKINAAFQPRAAPPPPAGTGS
ncbi:hypothetical protein AB5I41_20330 [Sphingomonas sp. MMS24-JH45]